MPCLPLVAKYADGVGIRSLFWYMSSYQNRKSSAVSGWPSDHFMPRRRWKTNVRPPSWTSQLFATFGTTFVAVKSK